MGARILWVGELEQVDPLRQALQLAGYMLVTVDSIDGAQAAMRQGSFAVVLISLELAGAASAIAFFKDHHPRTQMVAVTHRAVPPHVTLAIQAGIDDMASMRLEEPESVVARVREAIRRHDGERRELELLRSVRDLNDEFLNSIIALEKRNMELERALMGAASTDGEEGPFRILIIDDEPTVCALLKRLLDEESYQVMAVADGETGILLFRQEPFRLVVTDKNLPGMSGLDVLRAVKKIQPDTDVVVLTGYGTKEAAVDALNLGAAAFLEKPFDDVDAVQGTLEVLIAKQRMRRRERGYLTIIKERNREFLARYRTLRTELDERLRQREPPSQA